MSAGSSMSKGDPKSKWLGRVRRKRLWLVESKRLAGGPRVGRISVLLLVLGSVSLGPRSR